MAGSLQNCYKKTRFLQDTEKFSKSEQSQESPDIYDCLRAAFLTLKSVPGLQVPWGGGTKGLNPGLT